MQTYHDTAKRGIATLGFTDELIMTILFLYFPFVNLYVRV